MAAGGAASLADGADDAVRQATGYIQLLTGGEEECGEADKTFPTVAAGRALWDNPESRRQLIILTLGNHPRDYISKRLGVGIDIVEIAERLFFDIRDSREATGWVNAHVMMPESRSGSAKCTVQYRAAYWGGPLIASSILDVEERVPLDEVQRIADQEMLLQLKLRQALEFPLDDARSNLQFMKMYFDCEHREKKLDMAKDRFRHQCEQDIRKHEIADARLAAAAAREEARIAASQQRAARVSQQAEEMKKYFDAMVQLRQERRAAEDRLAAARAVASPLARLAWSTHASSSHVAVSKVSEQVDIPVASGPASVISAAAAA